MDPLRRASFWQPIWRFRARCGAPTSSEFRGVHEAAELLGERAGIAGAKAEPVAIFLHEVGHHVIGFDAYRLRCEEEYHAWAWSLAEMRRWGVEPDEKVNRRVELSMRCAVDKAVRRGLKRLPVMLGCYATRVLSEAA